MSTSVPPRPPRRPNVPPRPPVPATEALARPEPPEGPWWRNDWALAVVGLVAVLIGLALGLLIGKGETVTRTQAATTQTVTHTVHNTRTVVHVHTATVTTTAPSANTRAGGENSEAGGTQHFSGSGPRSLGTLTVTRESTLRWTSEGESFAITTSGSEPVRSTAHSGATTLEPGSYSNFQIHAKAPWTVTIAPAG